MCVCVFAYLWVLLNNTGMRRGETAERERWWNRDNEDLESNAKPFKTTHSQLINQPLDSRTHSHTHTRTHISHGFIRSLCSYGPIVRDKVHVLALISYRFGAATCKLCHWPNPAELRDRKSREKEDNVSQEGIFFL